MATYCHGRALHLFHETSRFQGSYVVYSSQDMLPEKMASIFSFFFFGGLAEII